MLCWRILCCRGYGGTVYAVSEESCSCCDGGYYTVGAMMELFMLYWRKTILEVLSGVHRRPWLYVPGRGCLFWPWLFVPFC